MGLVEVVSRCRSSCRAEVAARWASLGALASGPVVPGTGLVAFAAALVGVGAGLAGHDPVVLLSASTALAVTAAALHHLLARLEVGRLTRLAVIGATVVNPALVLTASTPRGAVLLAGSSPRSRGSPAGARRPAPPAAVSWPSTPVSRPPRRRSPAPRAGCSWSSVQWP